jgi:hypothetical protein
MIGEIKMVKISTLSSNTIVLVDGNSIVSTVSEILEDPEHYKNKKVYTTVPHYATFDASNIFDMAVDYEYNNGMYDEWDERIQEDITKEDVEVLQVIFDRILARNPSQNVSYEADELIEIDVQ